MNDISYVPELVSSIGRIRANSFPPVRLAATSVAEMEVGQLSPSVGTVVDRQADAFSAAVSDALDETVPEAQPQSAELALSSELGDTWVNLSSQARLSLIQGDRLRTDIGAYFGESAQADFAVAVISYSRALEIELFRRLFEPLTNIAPFGDAPNEDESGEAGRSLEMIRKFQSEDQPIAMGQMAACLNNLACGAQPNEFSEYLDGKLPDRKLLCSSNYPRWLSKFAIGYRNRAAHISRMSELDCAKARRYLLEDPRHLLVTLVELAPN